jgi:ubiquinone/menaquinone biosynthesis C-methylase UbiE
MKKITFERFLKNVPSNISSLHLLDYSSLFRLKIIHKFIGNVKGKSILDLGCGNGSISFLLWYLGAKVYSVDISKKALRSTRALHKINIFTSKHEAYIFQGDANLLPIRDEKFDMVFCVETLEHLQNDKGAVKEIEKVVKSGGIVVLALPFNSKIIGDKNSYSTYRYYSLNTIKKRLSSKKLSLKCFIFWDFPFLTILNLFKVRTFFSAIGNLIEFKTSYQKNRKFKNIQKFNQLLVTFYNTSLWRKVILPFLIHILDFNMLFHDLPYSKDVFLIYNKA